MPDYNTIRDEYLAWKSADRNREPVSFSRYAQLKDIAEGGNQRAVAYNDSILQQANAGIDRFLRPVSNFTADAIGQPIDQAVSSLIPSYKGEAASEALRAAPRFAAETAAYFTGAGEASGAARLLPFLSKAAGPISRFVSGAGLASSALKGAAENPDHPVIGGLASAATLPVGGAGSELGERAAAGLVTRNLSRAAESSAATGAKLAPETFVNGARDHLAAFIGSNIGAAGAMTGVQEAQSLATGQGIFDPFTTENVVGQAAGLVPFLPKTIHDAATLPSSFHASQERAKILQKYQNNLAERDKTAGALSVADASMPESANSEAVLSATANEAELRHNAELVNKLPARALEDVGLSEVATSKLMQTLPKDEAKEFVTAIKPSKDQREAVNAIRQEGATAYQRELDKLTKEEMANAFSKPDSSQGPVEFDPAIAEALSKANAKGLTDVAALTKFTHDVNETLSARYRDELKQIHAQNSEGADFFADENRPGREQQAPKMLNPEVVKSLQTEGRVPQITPEWYSDHLKFFIERSPTGSVDEAYQHTVQKAANLMLDLSEVAKKQKALELQQTLPTKPTQEQLDVEHYNRVKRLPTELQTWLTQQETADRAITKTKGDKEQSGWKSRRELVKQAIDNLDPSTGQTTITIQVGGKGKANAKKLVMPLEDAVKYTTKNRLLSGQGSTKEVSLDALQEKGLQAARTVAESQIPSDFEDVKTKLVTNPDEVGNMGLPSLDVETPDLGSKLSSLAEPNQQSGMLSRVREVYQSLFDPAQERQTWGAFRSIFADDKGGIRKEPRKRALFVSAVEAKLRGKGSEAAVEFTKKYLQKDTITNQDKQDAFRGYWGLNNDKWLATQKKIGELAGIDPSNVDLMTQLHYDPITHDVRIRGGNMDNVTMGLKELAVSHFRQLGYGPELVEHFSSMMERMGKVFKDVSDKTGISDIKILDPLTGEQVIQQISEQLVVMGLHGNYYIDSAGQKQQNPFIGLATKHIAKDSKLQPVVDWLFSTSIAHELVHGVEKQAAQDLKSADPGIRQRAEAYINMYNLASTLSREDRYAMLRNVMDVSVPTSLTRDESTRRIVPEIAGYIKHGASSESEFVATYAQMYIGGLVSGGKKLDASKLREVLAWEHNDVQDFLRGLFRDVSDFQEGFAKMTQNPMQTATDLKTLMTSYNAPLVAASYGPVHDAMRLLAKPDVRVLQAKESLAKLTTNLEPGAGPSLMASQDRTKLTKGDLSSEEFAPNNEAVDLAFQHVLGKKPGELNVWDRWFSPFVLAAGRVGTAIAHDSANLLMSNSSRRRQLVDNILAPFLTRNSRDKLTLDPNHPVQQIREGKNPRAREVVNRLAKNLQDLGEAGKLKQTTIDPAQQDNVYEQLLQHPDVAKETERELKRLRPSDRTVVIGVLNSMLQSYGYAGATLLKAQHEFTSNKLGRILQSIQPMPYDEAMSRGKGLLMGLPEALVGIDPKRSEYLLSLAAELKTPLEALQQDIAGRPWFMSEQRPGTWMVDSVNRDGTREVDGAESKAHAELLQRRLEKEGNHSFQIFDKSERFGDVAASVPMDLVERYTQMEQAATDRAIERIRALVGDNVASVLAAEFKPAIDVQKQALVAGIGGKLQHRKLVGGRERLDYLDVLEHYAHSLGTSVANRQTKVGVRLMQNDPRMKDIPEFSQMLDTNTQHVLTPQSELYGKLKTTLTAYWLGGNISSAIVEPTQSFLTLVPHLVRQGDSVMKAYGRLAGGLKTAVKLLSGSELSARADSASRVLDKASLPYEDQLAYYFRKFRDESPEQNPYSDNTLSGDHQAVLRARSGQDFDTNLPLKTLALNGLYQVASKGLSLYSVASRLNSRAAFVAGFEKAYSVGLSGQKAFDYARNVVYSTMFGGGKANASQVLSKDTGFMKPVLGIASTLQNYSLSMTTLMANYAREGFMSNKSLNPIERKQALKAFGVMATTQFALAGALGFPLVAASLAAFEKITGLQANAAVRQGLAKLGGDDEELGATISDLILNGAANQILGVDVSGRTGLSNILGTSPYNGFQLQDMAGPLPSTVQNIVEAVSSAAQGEYMSAAKSLVPQGFKNLVQEGDSVHKYGKVQFMDKQENLIMNPTKLQSVLYAVGFRPRELRQQQIASNLMQTSDKLASKSRSRDLDRLAQAVMQGDVVSVRDYIDSVTANDPNTDPRALVRSILDRAADMQTPTDLLSEGSRSNAQSRRLIASAMPGAVTSRRSEVKRLEFREQMLQSLGYPYGTQPSSSRDFNVAAITDELIQQQGLTRSEAARQAEVLLGASPYPQF
jgi:hypothetical protein